METVAAVLRYMIVSEPTASTPPAGFGIAMSFLAVVLGCDHGPLSRRPSCTFTSYVLRCETCLPSCKHQNEGADAPYEKRTVYKTAIVGFVQLCKNVMSITLSSSRLCKIYFEQTKNHCSYRMLTASCNFPALSMGTTLSMPTYWCTRNMRPSGSIELIGPSGTSLPTSLRSCIGQRVSVSTTALGKKKKRKKRGRDGPFRQPQS